MRTYPLIRYRWSNEHIMTALFLVIIMYQFPLWLQNPLGILDFLALLAASLILDAAGGYIKYKRFVCSVSAAVTAAILYTITPGIPLWCRLIGIFAAIIVAKQIWGGTGKNTMNPAILGYLVICLFYPGIHMPIEPSVLLIPGLVLSLPFIIFRPFVALGYFIGMLVAYITGDIASWQILLVNSIFFGCIVLTDPVTITPQKFAGLISGFLIGFLPMLTGAAVTIFPLMLLIFNLTSYLIDDYFSIARRTMYYHPIKIKSPYRKIDLSKPLVDLTGRAGKLDEKMTDDPEFYDSMTPETMLERIEANNVLGLGGEGFQTIDKIKTALTSNVEKKYLIVNAVECDKGLIHDKWLLRNRLEDICKGIRIISHCMEFSDIFLAVKDARDITVPDDVKVHKVKDYYPAGYEKTLIKSVLKKKIPADFIPAKLGILVLNVQTVLAIYEAVSLNKRADEKYITVANLKNGNAAAVKVKMGESVMKILEAVYPGEYPVFTGGGIMNAHKADDDEIVGKKTNFIAVSRMPRYKESPLCSNCNVCTMSCPQGLIVQRIADLIDKEKYEKVKKYRPEKCINCGLCSYVSRCGRNLSARVGEAKKKVLL